MAPTLKQIARETGLAISTVSRALNGHAHVDDETRRRVLETADRLGYRPSAAGRALRGSATRTVGVVLPDVQNHFYAVTVSVLQEQLEERGYGIVLAVTGNDPRRERDALDRLTSARVDGIVVVPSPIRTPPVPPGIPLVELNRQSARKVDQVLYDEGDGIRGLVAHLVENGHRDIAFIGGDPNLSTTRRRLLAYRAELAASGIDGQPEHEQLGRYAPDWGATALRTLMGLDPRPTAVVAASSEITLGALQDARRLGVRIPRDLSFVAFGDPDWYRVVDPPLTCYDQPIAQTAGIAVQMLADRMSGSDKSPTRIVVEGHLVLRDSVATAR